MCSWPGCGGRRPPEAEVAAYTQQLKYNPTSALLHLKRWSVLNCSIPLGLDELISFVRPGSFGTLPRVVLLMPALVTWRSNFWRGPPPSPLCSKALIVAGQWDAAIEDALFIVISSPSMEADLRSHLQSSGRRWSCGSGDESTTLD